MRKGSLVMMLLPLLPLLFVGTAAAATRQAGRDLTPEQREMVIRQAYLNATELVAAGGSQISFEIGDLRTLTAEEFATALWLDAVTMPGGDMVDMTRVDKSDNETESVVYRARWSLGSADALQGPGAAKLATVTVERVLAEAAREKPLLSTTAAITSFSVEVAFEGRRRQYRAAVLWLPPARGQDANVVLTDNITTGVEEALRERRPFHRALEHPAPSAIAAKTSACIETVEAYPWYQRLEDSTRHEWGEHFGELELQFACRCESSCRQTCEARVINNNCDDNGFPSQPTGPAFYCHKSGRDLQVNGTDSGDGSTRPASCAAGLGCVFKESLYCLSGINVTVGFTVVPGSGPTVNFSPSESPLFNASVGHGYLCRPCEAAPPPPGGGGSAWDGVQHIDPGTGGDSGEPGGITDAHCCFWIPEQSGCYPDMYGNWSCTTIARHCGQWGC